MLGAEHPEEFKRVLADAERLHPRDRRRQRQRREAGVHLVGGDVGAHGLVRREDIGFLLRCAAVDDHLHRELRDEVDQRHRIQGHVADRINAVDTVVREPERERTPVLSGAQLPAFENPELLGDAEQDIQVDPGIRDEWLASW